MALSIKPMPQTTGGKVTAGTVLGVVLTGITYVLIQLTGVTPPASSGTNQAVVDAKQDAAIAQNSAAIAEGKSDRKAILKTVHAINTDQAVIKKQLESIEDKLD